MFAVIYQNYVKPGYEIKYQELWNKIAIHFVKNCGALGSALHQSITDKELWIAYSRWPDKITRDNAWPGENAPSTQLPEDIQLAIFEIKNCVDEKRKLPEICMEVIDDLL